MMYVFNGSNIFANKILLFLCMSAIICVKYILVVDKSGQDRELIN